MFSSKCAKNLTFFSKNQLRKMIKKIEINSDVIEAVKNGKYVEGSLRIDAETGQLTFKAYNRKERRRQPDTLICETETGWLKESAQRYKFFNSVKKDLGRRLVDVVMHRELKQAMQVLEIEEIMDNI